MKRNFVILVSTFILFLMVMVGIIFWCDPFLIYHGPSSKMYYVFDNERIQNYGMVKFLEYDSIITGTSLTENFRTTQFDSLFESKSIKTSFSGATFYETAKLIELAYDSDHDLKYVLRTLDINHLMDDKDWIRTDLGNVPKYIFSNNALDQCSYLMNKDIFIDYCIPMIIGIFQEKEAGHTSFDDYASWRGTTSNADELIQKYGSFIAPETFAHLSEDEKIIIKSNINQNIIDLAEEHPDTEFIYYIPPYSIIFWGEKYESGEITKLIEAESIALEMMLKTDNISVYCYTNDVSLTSNLNMYTDNIHYCYKVNDEILDSISAEIDLLTSDNYQQYMNDQYEIYMNYNYNLQESINGDIDNLSK